MAVCGVVHSFIESSGRAYDGFSVVEDLEIDFGGVDGAVADARKEDIECYLGHPFYCFAPQNCMCLYH